MRLLSLKPLLSLKLFWSLGSALILLGIFTPAYAAAQTDTKKPLIDSLPSEAEIETIIAGLPDLNHLMDGLVDIAKDETLRQNISDAATHVMDDLEASGALELRDNGLPDFNKSMAVMLRAISDPEGMGKIINTLGEVADELDDLGEGVFKKEGQTAPSPQIDQ